MPDIGRLIVSEFNAIRALLRCCDIMHPRHRFDSHTFFLDTVCAMHPKMDLPVHRHRFFKHRQPVDIPTSEDASWIACDGEEDRRTIGTRQSYATTDVL